MTYTMDKELVSKETLSYLLDVPVETIKDWVKRRKIPYRKLNRNVRFHLKEVRAWYDARTFQPLR